MWNVPIKQEKNRKKRFQRLNPFGAGQSTPWETKPVLLWALSTETEERKMIDAAVPKILLYRWLGIDDATNQFLADRFNAEVSDDDQRLVIAWSHISNFEVKVEDKKIKIGNKEFLRTSFKISLRWILSFGMVPKAAITLPRVLDTGIALPTKIDKGKGALRSTSNSMNWTPEVESQSIETNKFEDEKEIDGYWGNLTADARGNVTGSPELSD